MDPIIQSPATEILINAESSREDFFRQASEALGETPETSASDDAAEAAAMRGTPAAPAKVSGTAAAAAGSAQVARGTEDSDATCAADWSGGAIAGATSRI
jgi:hypothetical protein